MGKRKSRDAQSEDGQEDSGRRKKERSEKKAKRNRMETILQAAAAAAERAEAAKAAAAEAAEAAQAAAATAADVGTELLTEPQPAAGSHDADAATAVAQQAVDEPAAGAAGERRKAGGKPAPVLPWMRVPIAIEASEGTLLEEVQGLDPRLRLALEGGPGTVPSSGWVWLMIAAPGSACLASTSSLLCPPTSVLQIARYPLAGTGVEVLFPVQTVVWRETAGGYSTAHDVCVCAPTGSGKTLSYALPVLQALAGRRAPALRALVVLPTRDLAAQVFAVLCPLCPALGLTAALACGKAPLHAEAELLAGGGIGGCCPRWGSLAGWQRPGCPAPASSCPSSSSRATGPHSSPARCGRTPTPARPAPPPRAAAPASRHSGGHAGPPDRAPGGHPRVHPGLPALPGGG